MRINNNCQGGFGSMAFERPSETLPVLFPETELENQPLADLATLKVIPKKLTFSSFRNNNNNSHSFDGRSCRQQKLKSRS